MRNLLIGPLGKILNIGGSRIYTTPNTIEVPEEDYIVSAKITGEFLTWSLDGRLWIYKRGTRYGILALKFSETTEKLEFGASKTISFSNERILARGLDWILTSKNIYMVSDEEPYIFSAKLFDEDISEKYLYSILRSGVISEQPSGFKSNVGSGIDPFTLQAWGKSDTNGNSEGLGYFSSDTELLLPKNLYKLDKNYAILPNLGDWQILPNFLLRRPNAPFSESYNGQKNLRPLIPLEFNLYSASSAYPSYGTGYDVNQIPIICVENELWARGFSHIGRVSILPAVFNEAGDVLEYYLYISPNYICGPYNQKTNSNLDADDEWLKLKIAGSLYGYYSEPSNSLSDELCEVAENTEIFIPENKEKINFLDVKIYVDILNSVSLILHDKGAVFFDGNKQVSYECPGLKQWLAPTENIKSFAQDYVMSHFDGGILNTKIDTGFNRQVLYKNRPVLTAKSYSGSKLLIASEDNSEGEKIFSVNKFPSLNQNTTSIAWIDIYKAAVNIKFLNQERTDTELKYIAPLIFDTFKVTTKLGYDYYYEAEYKYEVECYGKIFFIDPDSGKITTQSFSYDNFQCPPEYITSEDYHDEKNHFKDLSISQDIVSPAGLIKQNNTIGFQIYHFSELIDTHLYSYVTDFGLSDNYVSSHLEDVEFIPVVTIPEKLQGWNVGTLQNVFLEKVLNLNSSALSYAIFYENSTKTKLALSLSSQIASTGEIYNFYNNKSLNGKTYRNRNRYSQCVHVYLTGGKILVFRSELYPEIFDFDNELLRSKLY